MIEEVYAKQLEAASVMENIRMREAMTDFGGTGRGGNPERLPKKLLEAAKALATKQSLTAADLGHILKIPQPQAIALLYRLERIGLAQSELHHDTRIRIFAFQNAAAD